MSEDLIKVVLEELREHRRDSSARHQELSKRVNIVETWQANMNGKLAIIAIIFSAVGAWVVKAIKSS